jgi:hypothetical protein
MCSQFGVSVTKRLRKSAAMIEPANGVAATLPRTAT